MSIKVENVKPRNPLVSLCHSRKAGAHQKTEKAKRTKEKALIKKEWN